MASVQNVCRRRLLVKNQLCKATVTTETPVPTATRVGWAAEKNTPSDF